jgi:hypothetical protein
MPTAIEFSAAAWIAQNTEGGTHLSPQAQQAVSSFTTMWNFFESTLCDNRASIAAFERAVDRYHPTQVSEATAQALKACLTFWRFRYRTSDGFSPRFDGLYFRQGDRRAHVEEVLSGKADDPKAELLALMIIVYRLRNNLFHGLKTLEMLNDQVENLTNASRCLSAIMEAIPSRFVAMRRHPAATSHARG